jgi:D-glycero-alpha-D-manno-heptose-7-phosphate kinase
VSVMSVPLSAVRSRAPLRLGLAGGGTDVSPYSDKFGGAVLNVTIDRYALAFIQPSPDGNIHFTAADLEVEEIYPLDLATMTGGKLDLHAAVYRRMINDFNGGRPLPMKMHTSVDAPPGSGLGSSSALVVAMVEAFRNVLDVPLGPYEIAHLAFEIERVDLALAGGKQDQYAAAFGGLNYIEFLAGGRVIVNPLRISRPLWNELETSLVICFSGVSRRSENIIEQQMIGMTSKSPTTLNNLHQLKSDSMDMKQALLLANIPEMARILNKSWLAKKETATGVSTQRIDELSVVAFDQGALGCKVSGAGGGGFIMFIVPPERRVTIVRALNSEGATASGVQFTQDGAESWTLPNKNL